MPLRVAIIGAGEMGAAIAGQLVRHGAEVFTTLEGRSAATIERSRAAGMKDVEISHLATCDLILSILSSRDASGFAEYLTASIAGTSCSAIYVDCNAVSAKRLDHIAKTVTACGAAVVDGCLIGRPPTAQSPGPRFYVSGKYRDGVFRLRDYGLDVRDLGERFGAASALKLAHSGVSKGFIALATLAFSIADSEGVGTELREILSGRPVSSSSLISDPPKMPPERLGRWSMEMKEISDSVAGDAESNAVFVALSSALLSIASQDSRRSSASR